MESAHIIVINIPGHPASSFGRKAIANAIHAEQANLS